MSDVEIDAYLDGELDPERRLAVEDHLTRCPEAAARMLADMRARTALRLAHAEPHDAPPDLLATADLLSARLAGGKSRRSVATRFFSPARLGAIGALAAVFCGVLLIGPTMEVSAGAPDYVSDAVTSFRTGLLRETMVSQPETSVFDAGDVMRSTQIRVPVLPDHWQITDVQIFPSDDGPALQIMARTAAGQPVSIFAVRNAAAAPLRPVVVRKGDASVAYWRHGDIAYALTGMDSPEALDIAAEDLADNRLD
ncbi:anti-sigma factor family protein [Sphingomonas sanxanigenens]|uniref:anti-sigma factor family protein n=1 Tax=Sphingomonas sanxanigenens TaxID=397260 RepID=UPI001FDEFF83|nr:zf-HC2 domain-containing protein [Sphingomonas sanxanigenens]